MRTFASRWSGWLRMAPVVLAAMLLSGCQTLQYRDIQGDFERAVRAEQDRTELPFIDWYDGVVEELSPAHIGKLDSRLRANAWMLRSVSAWRAGRLDVARESADRGLREPGLPAQSRDRVVLRMMNGLIAEADAMREFRAAGGVVPAGSYRQYESKLKTAWTELQSAGAEIGVATPDSVKDYYHYQRWRVVQNWRQVIDKIEPQAVEEAAQARQSSVKIVGQSIERQAQMEKEAILPTRSLRKAIEAQEWEDEQLRRLPPR